MCGGEPSEPRLRSVWLLDTQDEGVEASRTCTSGRGARAGEQKSVLPLAEALGHALRVRPVRAERWVVRMGSLSAPALERLFVSTAVGPFLAHALLGITNARVDELLELFLRALGDLLDADLVGAVADVPPVTLPHLLSAGFDGPAEGVVPLRVWVALNRHREDEALFGRLDLRCGPVRASLHP
jgi:hypothetical protein